MHGKGNTAMEINENALKSAQAATANHPLRLVFYTSSERSIFFCTFPFFIFSTLIHSILEQIFYFMLNSLRLSFHLVNFIGTAFPTPVIISTLPARIE